MIVYPLLHMLIDIMIYLVIYLHLYLVEDLICILSLSYIWFCRPLCTYAAKGKKYRVLPRGVWTLIERYDLKLGIKLWRMVFQLGEFWTFIGKLQTLRENYLFVLFMWIGGVCWLLKDLFLVIRLLVHGCLVLCLCMFTCT